MELKKADENYTFTFDEILQMIDKVSESKLDEFHYYNDAVKISMKKKQKAVVTTAPVEVVTAPAAVVSGGAAAENKDVEKIEDDGSYYVIKSPIVGTFYASKEEGGEPLVKVGSEVKKDSIVAIIEAMKLMNEITAGADGEIAEILVDNGQLVEYGQEIMKIKL